MAEVKKKGKKRLFTGFGAFLLLVLAFVIFFSQNFTTVQVDGFSMHPTLKNRQRVLMSKAYWLIGPIRDKDIVVLHDPAGPGVIIKRVYRSGGEIVEPEWIPETANANVDYRVPDGEIYLLGDNRPVSADSRVFGPVDKKDIMGKVVMYR